MNKDFNKIHASNIYYQVASLLLYQSVFDNSIGKAFWHLLKTLNQAQTDSFLVIDSLQAYGNWFNALAQSDRSWQDFLVTQILWNDNPFSRQIQYHSLSDLSLSLINAVKHDLKILQTLYICIPQKVSEWIKIISLPSITYVAWEKENTSTSFLHTTVDWTDLLQELSTYYQIQGTGTFAQYKALRWQEHQLIGISNPDPIQLDEIIGYELQKEALIKNTECLLANYPSLNVLLYGSRGTGKSSLVKGLLQKYYQQGLRLIEVGKADLKDLPIIVDRLRNLAQKFIIFVDDLSFEEDDDAFKALKVVLEGSVTAKAQNVLVYATSNRRHLIREYFADRPRPKDADEIHHWDTMQEKLSFSDRFGLTLTFEPADQTKYLEIVHHLAHLAHLNISPEDLDFKAKQWATRHNGRSGRTARQFIDYLQGELYHDGL